MQRIGKTKTKGFTLIELLVVIAVIAVLASILFPVFASAKKTAQRANCANNMKQLTVGLTMYQSDFGGWFPLGGFKWADSDYSLEWQNVTYRYVKKDDCYRCPSTPCPNIDPAQPASYGSNLTRPRTPCTYLYNMGLGADLKDAATYRMYPKSHHQNEVVAPVKCAMLIEGNTGVDDSTFKGVDCHGQQRTLWLRDYTFYKYANRLTGGDRSGSYGLPHHEGANVTFVDGHTRFFKFKSTDQLQSALPWLIHVPLRSDRMFGRTVETEPWLKG